MANFNFRSRVSKMGNVGLGGFSGSVRRVNLPPAPPPPAPPAVQFIDVNGSTFNAIGTSSYYFKIDDVVNTFTITVNGLSGVEFTNLFDPTNFSNCKLSAVSVGPDLIPLASEVFVTNNLTLSASTGNLFTFYYFNTGSVIAGLASASTTLSAPTSGTFVVPTPTPTTTPTSTPTTTPTSTSTPAITSTPTTTPLTLQLNSFGNYRPAPSNDYTIYAKLINSTATNKEPLYSRTNTTLETEYAMSDDASMNIGGGSLQFIALQPYWYSQYETLLFLRMIDDTVFQWVYKTKVGHSNPFKLISRPIDIRLLPGYNNSTGGSSWQQTIQNRLSSVNITPFNDVLLSDTSIPVTQPVWKSVPWSSTPYDTHNTYSFYTTASNGLGGIMQTQEFTLTL